MKQTNLSNKNRQRASFKQERKLIFSNIIFSALAGALIAIGLGFLLFYKSEFVGILLILLGIILFILVARFNKKANIRAGKEIIKGIEDLYKPDASSDFNLSNPANPVLKEIALSLANLNRSKELSLSDVKAENELQEIILENLDEGIILVDSSGYIQLETEVLSQLLEQNPGASTDINYIFLKNVNYNHLWAILENALDEDESINTSFEISAKDGKRILDVYALPIKIRERHSALGVLRDSTQLRKLEESRTDFVANVSHELKTPLTSIKGYIELLENPNRSKEEIKQFLEIIHIETDRLENLIADLLDLSEIEAGDRQRQKDEQVNIYEVALEVKEQLSQQAQAKDISIHLELAKDRSIQANVKRIKQLLLNLISNSIKYGKEGGDIWIRSSSEKSRIALSVEDNGIGIRENELDRIFERFYRVDKSRSSQIPGTGLGLSIVKHIVNLYGGTLSIDSSYGEGTTITVIFPTKTE